MSNCHSFNTLYLYSVLFLLLLIYLNVLTENITAVMAAQLI